MGWWEGAADIHAGGLQLLLGERDGGDRGGTEKRERELNSTEKCCLVKLLKLHRPRRDDAPLQKALASEHAIG